MVLGRGFDIIGRRPIWSSVGVLVKTSTKSGGRAIRVLPTLCRAVPGPVGGCGQGVTASLLSRSSSAGFLTTGSTKVISTVSANMMVSAPHISGPV